MWVACGKKSNRRRAIYSGSGLGRLRARLLWISQKTTRTQNQYAIEMLQKTPWRFHQYNLQKILPNGGISEIHKSETYFVIACLPGQFSPVAELIIQIGKERHVVHSQSALCDTAGSPFAVKAVDMANHGPSGPGRGFSAKCEWGQTKELGLRLWQALVG